MSEQRKILKPFTIQGVTFNPRDSIEGLTVAEINGAISIGAVEGPLIKVDIYTASKEDHPPQLQDLPSPMEDLL